MSMKYNVILSSKTPRALALEYESSIKDSVVTLSDLDPAHLMLLSEDEDGAYWSQKEPGMLCVLVLGQENGHLYLVTSQWDDQQGCLSDFKCGILG